MRNQRRGKDSVTKQEQTDPLVRVVGSMESTVGCYVALYCTYMPLYESVRAYTYVYKTAGPWNLMLSGHARSQFRVLLSH